MQSAGDWRVIKTWLCVYKKIGRSIFPLTDRPHSKSAEMTIKHGHNLYRPIHNFH